MPINRRRVLGGTGLVGAAAVVGVAADRGRPVW
ncbi:MAG TPA: twin-arginine translocation signal domain-containing protein [Mycolicibacillus parakoreensis]|nr:twin-arginine translocation signal domain-containing protein [Mycolicibacillus parakoreensis]